MIPSAPKFRKIVLLLKDEDNKPTTRMEYMDSAMIITGNYVIITEEEMSDNLLTGKETLDYTGSNWDNVKISCN